MSDSDEIAQEARRLAAERAFTAERFLSSLDRGYYTDFNPRNVPAAERDLLLPALRTMVEQHGGTNRLNAARTLVELNERLGWEVLIECLRSADSALHRGALDRLNWLKIRDRLRSSDPPIKAGELLAAFEPSLAGSDQWNRAQAVMLIGYLGTPQAFDRLVALLSDARPQMRAEAAIVLADAGYDRGALAVLDEMLQAPNQPKRYFLIRALEHLCESPDADVSARAAAAAISFIRNNLAHHAHSALEANFFANDIRHCMDGLAAACLPEKEQTLHEVSRQVFREVLAAKLEVWVRGMALKHLAQLEGQAGIRRLIDALSDPDLCNEALEGLASLAAGSDDPAVLEALGQEIRRGNTRKISNLVKAFLAVGGKAKTLAQDIVDQLEPEVSMTVRWLLNNIGPREAAAKLQPACGGVAARDELLQTLATQWQAEPDATGVIWKLLDGWKRLAVPFYKTVEGHVDHAETVRDLAAIAYGGFTVEEVVQTTESSGDFQILLVQGGTGYSFPVQNHGRWCNVRAVIDGLNDILERLGLVERYIEINSGTSDVALVTFARTDIFMPLARELGIPLGRAA